MLELDFWDELTSDQASGMTIADALIFRASHERNVSGFIVAYSQKDAYIGGISSATPFTVYRHVLCMRYGNKQKIIHLSKVAPNLATIIADLNIVNFLPNINPQSINYQSRDGFLLIDGLDISGGFITGNNTLTGDSQYGLFIDPADEEKMILTNMDQVYEPL